ncbi:MAG TPA: hypothetical protein VHO70_15710 [Chitinispirillaceae bacterium]|nr:hypothetical protein [Chitinispirillaceae bacterium]
MVIRKKSPDGEKKSSFISGCDNIEPDSYLNIAKEPGTWATLTKPFNKMHMIEAIDSCITKSATDKTFRKFQNRT